MRKIEIILSALISILLTAGIVYGANTFPTTLNDWEAGDIIEESWANALEDKLGVDDSAVTSSLDYLVKTHSQPDQLTVGATTTIDTDLTGLLYATAGVISTTSVSIGDLGATSSAVWAGKITDETGTGVMVFGTAPSFTTSITTPAVLTGNVALTIGDATTDSITFVADGTGNAEFTFPNDVIGDADIDWGSGAGQVSGADITFAEGDMTDNTIISADIKADTITHADIVDSDQADTKCFWFEDPTAADDFKSIWTNKTANDFLLTEIWCETDQTVTMMLQVDDGSPADVDGTDLVCDSDEEEDTSLDGDTTVAAGEELDLDLVSVSGTPTWVSICFTGNWVD